MDAVTLRFLEDGDFRLFLRDGFLIAYRNAHDMACTALSMNEREGGLHAHEAAFRAEIETIRCHFLDNSAKLCAAVEERFGTAAAVGYALPEGHPSMQTCFECLKAIGDVIQLMLRTQAFQGQPNEEDELKKFIEEEVAFYRARLPALVNELAYGVMQESKYLASAAGNPRPLSRNG